MTGRALPPGATIGILGGGQLGRMLSLAAANLGLRTHIYSDDERSPAFHVTDRATLGDYGDTAAIEQFARSVDVVTYEFENVPLEAAAVVGQAVEVRPGAKALAVAQDRLEEKRFISGLGIPVAPFAEVSSPSDLDRAIAAVGTPAILKTRRLGYDGKGQARVADGSALGKAFDAIGQTASVLEGYVAFAREVSVLAVRSISGDLQFYAPPVNVHTDGILSRSSVPAPLTQAHRTRGEEIAATIADALDYVGVLAVELFHMDETGPDPLIVNEIAPRVHNSGHWTQDACACSQFENHIRAVAGWPLGSTQRHSDAVMTNLIGADVGDWAKLAAKPGACLHLYGKRHARPGRKMGHVTQLMPRGDTVGTGKTAG